MAFSKFPRIKEQGKLFENFSQNFVKIVLCGVVGSERTFNEGSVNCVDAGYIPNKQNLFGKP